MEPTQSSSEVTQSTVSWPRAVAVKWRQKGQSKLATVPARLLDQARIFVSQLLHLSMQPGGFRGALGRITEMVMSLAPMDLDLLRVGHHISPTIAGGVLSRFVGHSCPMSVRAW